MKKPLRCKLGFHKWALKNIINHCLRVEVCTRCGERRMKPVK